MLCKCVENGQARVVGTKKITWFEKGMTADIEVGPKGEIPSHFVKVEGMKAAKKGAKDDLDEV